MGRSSIHYVLPIFLMVAVSLSTMVGLKITQMFTDPSLFMDATVQAAAEAVQATCSGAAVSKQLPPPPPNTALQIMRCDLVAGQMAALAVWTAMDLAEIAELGTKVGKIKGEIDHLKTGRKWGVFTNELEDSIGDWEKKLKRTFSALMDRSRRSINRRVVIASMFTRTSPLINLALPYLGDLEYLIDLIETPHVNLESYPHTVTMLNLTGDVTYLERMYNRSSDLATEYNNATLEEKTRLITYLSNLGYIDALSVVDATEESVLFPLGTQDNINPEMVGYILLGIYDALENYEGDATENLQDKIINLAELHLNGNLTLEQTLEQFRQLDFGNIKVNQEATEVLLEKLVETKNRMQIISDKWVAFQQEVGSYLGQTCEVLDMLSVPEVQETGIFNELKLAKCGAVFDCSLETQCILGMPIVAADPWIPYWPVSRVDASLLGELSQLIGFQFSEKTRIIDKGSLALCAGWDKVRICTLSDAYKVCKVVDCGRKFHIEWTFNPTVTSTLDLDNGEVTISGNFQTW
ncbi:MAG TPA: hypothetical protein ENN60_04230 [archaeon]|nr:hypothetical protein [archaeon]